MSDTQEAERPSISKKTLAAIGVAGALGFGILIGAVTAAAPSFAQTPSSSSDSGSTSSGSTSSDSGTPAPPPHHNGNCPHMGGSSDSGSTGSSDSGASTASNSNASLGV